MHAAAVEGVPVPGTSTSSSAAGASVDDESAARSIALRLLESQPRTRVELERALARRGVPRDAATAVLDRFAEVGLIDDEAFAQAWVTSRHTGRGLGRRALTVELQRRGVDAQTVAAAVSAVSTDDEEVAARALADRRLRTMAGLPADTRMRQLVGMLARKGFSQGLAVRVAREAIAADALAADALADDAFAADAVADDAGAAHA
ncbi:MAG: regulatory protein [Frankiaceae bacterium]|jgi:regulatory protein|nr:regulatory protein [Frankiaceae bacterium]